MWIFLFHSAKCKSLLPISARLLDYLLQTGDAYWWKQSILLVHCREHQSIDLILPFYQINQMSYSCSSSYAPTWSIGSGIRPGNHPGWPRNLPRRYSRRKCHFSDEPIKSRFVSVEHKKQTYERSVDALMRARGQEEERERRRTRKNNPMIIVVTALQWHIDHSPSIYSLASESLSLFLSLDTVRWPSNVSHDLLCLANSDDKIRKHCLPLLHLTSILSSEEKQRNSSIKPC